MADFALCDIMAGFPISSHIFGMDVFFIWMILQVKLLYHVGSIVNKLIY